MRKYNKMVKKKLLRWSYLFIPYHVDTFKVMEYVK